MMPFLPDPDNDAPLTPRQNAAIPLVVAAPSLRQAARDVGVARSTILRWMQDPVFRAELDRAREAAASVAYAKLQQLTLTAAANLEEALNSPDPAERSRATRLALDVAIKAETNHDLRKRIDLLNGALRMLKGM